MNHVINVVLVNPALDTADVLRSHNPLEVAPSDTVEWKFTDLQGNVQPGLQIEFLGFLPRNRNIPIAGGPGVHPLTSTPQNPTVGQSAVKPNPDQGVYFYRILRGNQEIKWAAPVFMAGNFQAFFGCLVRHDPP